MAGDIMHAILPITPHSPDELRLKYAVHWSMNIMTVPHIILFSIADISI